MKFIIPNTMTFFFSDLYERNTISYNDTRKNDNSMIARLYTLPVFSFFLLDFLNFSFDSN